MYPRISSLRTLLPPSAFRLLGAMILGGTKESEILPLSLSHALRRVHFEVVHLKEQSR